MRFALLLTAALADGLLLHGLQPHTQSRCEQPSIRCQLPDDTSTTPLEKDIDVSEAATALEEILQLEATATAQPNTARFFAVEHQFDREQVILPRPLEIPTPCLEALEISTLGISRPTPCLKHWPFRLADLVRDRVRWPAAHPR